MSRGCVLLPMLALAILLFPDAAGASDFQEKGLNVTPFGGWTFFDRELNAPTGPALENNVSLGGRIGFRLVSPLWLELAGGYTPTTSNGFDATWTHLSANLMLASSKRHAVQPFLSLGGGLSKFVPPWSPDETEGTFEAAAGVKVKLTDAIGLRIEARNVLLVPREDYARSHLDNIIAGAGLVLAFGGKPSDSDLDGVSGRQDHCPDTPRGCRVDVRGCPIDTDRDGVCDGMDACADTTRGCVVNARGCPIDADRDGVCDGVDSCAGTTRGCWVDAHGCPFDSDGDGVFDGIDKCPDSPKGASVDPAGCPISKVLIQWPPLHLEINQHRDSRESDVCSFYFKRENKT